MKSLKIGLICGLIFFSFSCEKQEFVQENQSAESNIKTRTQQSYTFRMLDQQDNVIINTDFDIYDSQSQLVTTVTSNSTGRLQVTLSSGIYYFETAINGVKLGSANINTDNYNPTEYSVWVGPI